MLSSISGQLDSDMIKGGLITSPQAHLKPYGNYSSLYVPYYKQERSYSCGEASLRMLFAYCGLNVSEEVIGAVANWDPSYGTYNLDLLRAAHFSILSRAIQDSDLRGYPGRPIGFPAFQAWDMSINDLIHLIDLGLPVLVLTRYYYGAYGHFRIVKGYDKVRRVLIVHDPWYSQQPYAGPNTLISYDEFDDLWDYSGHWGMIISPWVINYTIEDLAPNNVFTIRVNITYHVPPPFDPADFPASDATLNITVPENYTLLSSPSIIFDDSFEGGESKEIEIKIQAPSTIDEDDKIVLMAYGKIHGSSVSYSYYEDYVGSIEEINLVDYKKPRILSIEHELSQDPVRVNITVKVHDTSDVSVYIIYNRMNMNEQYKVLKASVRDGFANATIYLTRGNVDIEYCVRVMDSLGNTVVSNGVIFHVTDEPPLVQLETDKMLIKDCVEKITIRWVIHDDFEVSYTTVYLDDNVIKSVNGALDHCNISLTKGIHELKVVAVDSAYQQGSDTMIIIYDTQSPTISTTINNQSVMTEYVQLTFNIDDDVAINRSLLYIDGKLVLEASESINYATFMLPGYHEVQVITEDMVGHTTVLNVRILVLPVISVSATILALILIVIIKRRRMR